MVRALAFGIGLALATRAALAAPFTLAPAAPTPSNLGSIDFPVTGPPVARGHFLRGMLALHSFWYEEAADEFRAATAAAPDFAMGYWGEALTHYHPVWSEEDVLAARTVLAKLPHAPALSAREEAFIDSARLLFGAGTRAARWRGYADALGKLCERFPSDDEAATLHAVALLGAAMGERTLDGGNPSFRPFAQAGAIGLAVLGHNPQHPGAAHYVIHAFDDPEHAILALPAARRYAEIAPEAYHARHMPSHIFVQLGMWPEAIASNEAAWVASAAWVRRKGLDASYQDFHSLSWLLSIRFELGQRRQAEEVLGRAREALARSRVPGRLPLIYSSMAAEYLLTTEDWRRTDELLAPLTALTSSPSARPEGSASNSVPQAPLTTCHPAAERAAHAAAEARALIAFIRGEAAAARHDTAPVVNGVHLLAELEPKLTKGAVEVWQVRELELVARLAELQGKTAEAVAALRKAIAVDERMPPSGPAGDAPPRERLGELLLRQGQDVAAAREFQRVLEIHPRRARALLGAARAATAIGDAGADGAWSRLASVWADADSDTPGVQEARRHAVQKAARSP
jgi:tetratricopeptide (TPR) repeat protein